MTLINATSPLITPTHDGSGQATHPCVIDFLLEHNMQTWAGYRYWMVMTPYPNATNAHEDPNILASHDGLTWVVPNGMVNPLDDAVAGYNSDPDMVYNPDTDELWVYYRTSVPYSTHIRKLVKVSADMSYTDPIILDTIAPWTPADVKDRSLIVWRESSTKWHMWGGGGAENPPHNFYYFFSTDGINWSEPVQCFNEDGLDPIQALLSSVNGFTWHHSGKPNYREKRIEFLCSNNSAANGLYFMYCKMHNPTLFYTPIPTKILSSNLGAWDSYLYRPSFVIEKGASGYIHHLWYSAFDANQIQAIGYTSGDIGTTFKGKGGGMPMDFFGLVGADYKKSYIVLDTFNRADNPSSLGNADTGQAWIAKDNVWGILSGEAYTPASGSPSLIIVDSGVSTNFKISVRMAKWGVGSQAPGLAIRAIDSDNMFRFTQTTTSSLMFQKKVAGVIITLGDYTGLTLADNDVMSIFLQGNEFKLYLNDTLLGTFTDAFNDTVTTHGLCTGTGSVTGRWDDFKIEAI